MSGPMSRLAGRHAALFLVSTALVLGTLLLVRAEVKGMEGAPSSVEEAGIDTSWSRLASLARPRPPIPVGRPLPVSGPSLTEAPLFVPTASPFRRLLPSPTPAPLPTPDGVNRRVVVPILMYHHVAVAGPEADAIRTDLSVSPARFEAQLRYLIERGYQPIALRDLIMHIQVGEPLPLKPVVLTFDDGFKDQFTNAYPLLKRYGLRGTFFIITGFVDEGREEYMSWADIELLHAEGMEIGSHSYTHPSLRGKSFNYVVWQVLGSKEAIEARTNDRVRFFSYPSGQYDKLVVDVLESAGYWGAVTVEAGSLQSSQLPFELRRIRVRGRYELEDFDHWLNYWLSHP